MKSIQTKISIVILAIMIVVTVTFIFTATTRTNAILDNDSDQILLSAVDYYANIIDDNFRSAEQSVGSIYNYAMKRAETYTSFLDNEYERDRYTNDISELGKSIAENTRGAMAVYLRYNPDDYGPSNGFWYTINLEDGSWQSSVPTDMSMYDKDDVEHVGWYYIPVAKGEPMWMDPYFNKNLGVEMISYIIPYYYGNYTVGIMGMDIDMSLLREATSQISVYKNGHAFLITKGGDLIYHEDYREGVDFDGLDEGDKEYFRNVLDSEMNSVNIGLSRNGEQQKIILKELRNGMILGVYAPLNEIREPQQNLVSQFLKIAIGILFLAIVICLIWVRTIIKPLKRMSTVAEHYAAGDFDEEMNVRSNDEVGKLSRSLQAMSTSIKQQIELANSANRAKSEFLANMSHEIRTPINAVLGMNEMILREAKDDDILEYSTNIQTSGKTLLSLINSILDFSKIEDGKMEIIPVSYDTAGMINNLVNSISGRARDKGLEFIVDIDESLPVTLYGDDVRFSQIIMNLLTNAVKYTEKGVVTLSIKDGGRHDGAVDIITSVKDTGIGIRKEDKGKLIESFSRLEEERNRNIEGTGLGMAIVTRLLSMMDSELKVDSIYGKGSVFSFTLTQRIIDEQPIGNYEERIKNDIKIENNHENISVTGAEILVVDDNDMNLKVAKNLMKIFGIVSDTASSGREAIEMLKVKTYNIVFLDHMMPRMDGIETLHKIHGQKLIPDSTIMIALTANAVVGAKEIYIKEGFDDYLSKPIDMERLEKIFVKYLPEDLILSADESGEDDNVGYVETAMSENGSVLLEFAPKKKSKHDSEGLDENFVKSLEKGGINVEDGIKYCAGNAGFYKELLEDYANTCQDKSEELKGCFAEKKWDSYRILIHSLKSSSRTIGANEVFSLAKELEDAAKKYDEDFILDHNSEFLALYSETAQFLDKELREE